MVSASSSLLLIKSASSLSWRWNVAPIGFGLSSRHGGIGSGIETRRRRRRPSSSSSSSSFLSTVAFSSTPSSPVSCFSSATGIIGKSSSSSSQALSAAATPTTKTALIFDTETTGMVNFRNNSTALEQPDLIQLGFILVEHTTPDNRTNNNNDTNEIDIDNATWKIRNKGSFLVQLANNAKIDLGAQNVHGISSEHCKKYGLPSNLILTLFENLVHKADIIVAHNLKFDNIVMETAFHRRRHHDNNTDSSTSTLTSFTTLLSSKEKLCTMMAMVDVCKLPSKFKQSKKGGNKTASSSYKWPSLLEAYEFVNNDDTTRGLELEDDGHDAMIDAEACYTVYQYLVHHGCIETAATTEVVEDDTAPQTTPSIEPVLTTTDISTDTETFNAMLRSEEDVAPSDDVEYEQKLVSLRSTVMVEGTVSPIDDSFDKTPPSNKNGFRVKGNTYPHKEKIKQLGGKWNGPSKEWIFYDNDDNNTTSSYGKAFSELESYADLQIIPF